MCHCLILTIADLNAENNSDQCNFYQFCCYHLHSRNVVHVVVKFVNSGQLIIDTKHRFSYFLP